MSRQTVRGFAHRADSLGMEPTRLIRNVHTAANRNNVRETPVEHVVGQHCGEEIPDIEPVTTPTRLQLTEADPAKSATSSNKDLTRDVTPNPNLTTFLPLTKKTSQKKMKNYLNRGGMYFQPRDLLILQLTAAHGWLSLRSVIAFTGSTSEIRKSLKRLVDHGLMANHFRGINGEVLYTLTPSGLRQIHSGGFSTKVIPKMISLEHTDAITAVHIHIQKITKNTGVPNLIFLTERELQATINCGQLPTRVTTLAPWTQQYHDFANWVPTTVDRRGKLVHKRPDGLLLNLKDGKAQLPIPVEVERTAKTVNYYQNSTVMFADAASKGHLSTVVYYFAPRWNGTFEAVQKALTDVVNSREGFRYPSSLPKIDYHLENLDDFYTPVAIRNNWLTKTQKRNLPS